jgi:AraC-like DNA-binding protein
MLEIRVGEGVSGQQPVEIASLLHINASSSETPWMFSRHGHGDFLELSLITEGQAELEHGYTRYTLRPGDLIIKNAGVLHAERALPGLRYEQYCLGLSGVCDQGWNMMIPSDACPVLHTGKNFDYLYASIRYLFELSSISHMQAKETMGHMAGHILSVLRILIQDAAADAELKQHSELVERVLRYIDQHFNEAISLDVVAKTFFISPSYLSHKFKEEVGVTVNQYILNRKMGEAQMRLAFQDTPIKEIAVDCGYSSLQYFYPVFKKAVGTTPREFRDNYRELQCRGE